MGAYVAIDFETANERRESPCAVGVVRVDDGAVTAEWATLIDPETDFAAMNISIHGITPQDVQGAPMFADVLPVILELSDGAEALVAHSAAFDMQVLTRTAVRYDLDLPVRAFACTRVFARHWFPGWPSYALSYVSAQLALAEELGGDNHHDALWDACAAMLIAQRGLAERGHRTWSEAADQVRIRLGTIGGPDYLGCITKSSSSINPVRSADAELDPAHPLHGQRVAFTGTLAHYTPP